jgi:hypothetical protein
MTQQLRRKCELAKIICGWRKPAKHGARRDETVAAARLAENGVTRQRLAKIGAGWRRWPAKPNIRRIKIAAAS